MGFKKIQLFARLGFISTSLHHLFKIKFEEDYYIRMRIIPIGPLLVRFGNTSGLIFSKSQNGAASFTFYLKLFKTCTRTYVCRYCTYLVYVLHLWIHSHNLIMLNSVPFRYKSLFYSLSYCPLYTAKWMEKSSLKQAGRRDPRRELEVVASNPMETWTSDTGFSSATSHTTSNGRPSKTWWKRKWVR